MAQPTLLVKDANGNNQTVFTHNVNGQLNSVDSQSMVLSADHPAIAVLSKAGLGGMTSLVNSSANGTAVGTLPAGSVGVRFYLGSTDFITFTVANSAPSSTPLTFTIGGSTTGPNWDENLSAGQMVYVTSITGTPKFRWI